MEFVGQSLADVLNPDKKLGNVDLKKRKESVETRGIGGKKVAPLPGGGLPPALLKKVGNGVASALNHLHTGTTPPILHMDLNPGNILLTADGTVKLSDFVMQCTLTLPGFHAETFKINGYFASPEVALENLAFGQI